MKKDVQFSGFKLMPRRLDSSAEGAMQDLKNISDIEEINRARADFQFSAKTRGAKPEGRKTRDEKPFISKSKFVLSHRDFTCFEDPEDVLLSLLADSSTLFSRQYQAYEMNHPFFRDLRSEHGKTKKEELQCSKDYALRNIQEYTQRERYESILSKLEEKAALEGRKVLGLEYRLMRQIAKSNRIIIIRFSNDSDLKSANEAFKAALYDHRFDELFYEHWKHWVYTMLPEPLCSVLERWFPDIQFGPEEKASFSIILEDYFSRLARIPVEKNEVGHFIPFYTQNDSIRCKEYLEKKLRLEEAVRRHKAWKPEDPKQLFKEGYTYRYKKDKTAVCSKQIGHALTKFLGKPCEADEALECMVKRAERTQNIDTDLFPFHYLMVAVTDQVRLTSIPETVGSGRILTTCTSPYKLEHLKSEQRIKRIRLLHELNIACGLNREARSKNWNLFLRVHGTRIESRKEFDLWKDIIYPESGEEAEENIPVIELTLLCLDCLETCLSNQMETLYCYHNGSPLHQGRFLEFIEQNPDILKACVKRVAQKDWDKYKQKYLREWGKLECDPDVIRTLCSERADLIRWGGISAGLNEKLKDFCSIVHAATIEELETDMKSENNIHELKKISQQLKIITQRIEGNIQELKLLLVEAAFRTILKQEAICILAGQAEKLLSEDGYKIYVTDLEWSP